MERKRLTYRSIAPVLMGVVGLWVGACLRFGLNSVMQTTAALMLAIVALVGWRAIARW